MPCLRANFRRSKLYTTQNWPAACLCAQALQQNVWATLSFQRLLQDYISQRCKRNRHTFQLQGFSEVSYRATHNLTIDAGVNARFLFLNKTWNVDPRFGISWKFLDKQELSFGYGLHSQYQGLEIYMTKLFSQAVSKISQ